MQFSIYKSPHRLPLRRRPFRQPLSRLLQIPCRSFNARYTPRQIISLPLSHTAIRRDHLRQIPPVLARLIGTQVKRRRIRRVGVDVNRLGERACYFHYLCAAEGNSSPWLRRLFARLAVLVPAPGFAAAGHHLR